MRRNPIRDSFACTVTPFLALQAKELHVIDVRNYSYYVGEKINVYDYIEEIQPDYVIVEYVERYANQMKEFCL